MGLGVRVWGGLGVYGWVLSWGFGIGYWKLGLVIEDSG
jgi:hypothetical protein